MIKESNINIVSEDPDPMIEDFKFLVKEYVCRDDNELTQEGVVLKHEVIRTIIESYNILKGTDPSLFNEKDRNIVVALPTIVEFANEEKTYTRQRCPKCNKKIKGSSENVNYCVKCGTRIRLLPDKQQSTEKED